LAWSPDGSQVLTAGKDGHAHFWDAEKGAWSATVESRDKPNDKPLGGCSFSPDGSEFVLKDEEGWEVFDARTRTSLRKLPYPMRKSAWAPVGNRTASWGEDGLIEIRDFETGRLLRSLEGTEKAKKFLLSPDGRFLATHWWPFVVVFDITTGVQIAKIDGFHENLGWTTHGYEMDWSADGTLLIVADVDYSLSVIDPGGKRVVGRLLGHSPNDRPPAYSGKYALNSEVLCKFSGWNRYAVTAFVDGIIKIWDVVEERSVAQIATDVAFKVLAVRGERICLGDDQGFVHFFRLERLPPDQPASPIGP
jgi:WD40 repeat protein